ncbi:MAG: hypothetical protein OSB58_06865 [Alphaproteobacteria bacterium]|nr:hypothetical protein [Alphaproteobacteria bacterium]
MTVSMNREGFWTFRYAGNHGSGYGMFALETGIIVGADVMGGTWDGTYEIVDKHFHLDLAVTFPPGTTDVITGATSTTEHTERLTLALPNDFEERDITVQTSRGPLAVNCRKIRGWPD